MRSLFLWRHLFPTTLSIEFTPIMALSSVIMLANLLMLRVTDGARSEWIPNPTKRPPTYDWLVSYSVPGRKCGLYLVTFPPKTGPVETSN
jgi:hypothetical protein